MLQYSKLLT